MLDEKLPVAEDKALGAEIQDSGSPKGADEMMIFYFSKIQPYYVPRISSSRSEHVVQRRTLQVSGLHHPYLWKFPFCFQQTNDVAHARPVFFIVDFNDYGLNVQKVVLANTAKDLELVPFHVDF